MKQLIKITPSQIPAVLKYNGDNGFNTFLHGASGIGKTAINDQYAEDQAAERGLDFLPAAKGSTPKNWETTYGLIDIRVAVQDSLDIKGAPMLDTEADMTRFLANSVLPNVERHGKFGLCSFDELPQGMPSVVNALSQIFLGGKIGDSYIWPEGWQIAATGNRAKDQAATNKIGAHIYNRFLNYEVVPSTEDFAKYLLRNGSDGRVGGFVRLREELLQNYERGDIAFPSPRVLEQCDKMLRNISDKDFLHIQLSAALSEGVATELMGYLEICTQITSFNKIVADPMGAKIPTPGEKAANAATFALIGMCAGKRLTENNIDAVAAYVERLPEDFVMTWMLDVINRAPDLQETVAFSALRQRMGDNAV